MKVALSIFSLLLLALPASCSSAGVAAALDQGVVTEVESIVLPYIVEAINAIDLPDISEDGFKVTDLYMHFDPIDPADIVIQMQASNNAVVLSAHNIAGKIKGHFKYTFLFVPIHGDFEANIEDGGASLTLSMPMTQQELEGQMIPAVAIDHFDFDLDKHHVKLKIHGSIIADVLNLFIQLFENVILNIIEDEIEDNLPDSLLKAINGAFLDSQGKLELSNGVGFDFCYTAYPTVLDQQMELFLNGTFYYAPFGMVIPISVIPEVTLDPTSQNSVQLDVSKYTVDSLLLALDEGTFFNFVIDGSMLEPTLDFTLDTTHLEEFFPGLVAVFGPDIPMSIAVSTIVVPESIIHEDQMGALLSMALRFDVQDLGSAFTLSFHDVEILLSLYMEDFIIYPGIEHIKIDKITVEDNKIEEIKPTKLKTLLNSLIAVVVPVINKALQDGIPFPQEIAEGKITVESAAIKAWENYLQVQMAPHFHF